MKQKKNLLFLVGILSVLLVFGFVLVGCSDDPPADPGVQYKKGNLTMTVWGNGTEGSWEVAERFKGTYSNNVIDLTHGWMGNAWKTAEEAGLTATERAGTFTFTNDGATITLSFNNTDAQDLCGGTWTKQ